MEVSVVVVTHNQHDLLRQCLCSVREALEEIDGEVIVIDNASTDATPHVMEEEFPEVRYVSNATNVHYTRAVNQGMRAGEGEFYFLLNDDTVLDPGCLRTLLDFMHDHPRCGAVGPRFLTPGTDDVQVSAQRSPTPLLEVAELSGLAWRFRHAEWARSFQLEYDAPLGTQEVGWSCGGALLVRADVMQHIGYHDEQYLFYCDETDLGRRLREARYQVWHCAEASLYHHHGMSTVKTDRSVRFELIAIRSRRHYYRKFFGLLAASFVEVSDAVFSALRGLAAAARLERELAGTHARHLRLMLDAIYMPREEVEAIAGYRKAEYNGDRGLEPV